MKLRYARPALFFVGALSGSALWAPLLSAQDAQTAPTAANLASRLGGDLSARLQSATDLLNAGDASSASQLRDLAQSALQTLQNATKTDVLNAAPRSLPGDSITASLAEQAARAHWLWGIAAERFARRDEAVTALARARRLAVAAAGADDSSILLRDINLELGKVLGDGLPLIAPADVLDDIAQLVHGGQWTPRTFGFDADADQIGAAATLSHGDEAQLLVTDGQLFPPPLPGADDLAPRTPTLYRSLAPQQLPASLKLNKMVAGYARQNDGPNKGQWRQIVRVFYASDRLTQKQTRRPAARARFGRAVSQSSRLLRKRFGIIQSLRAGRPRRGRDKFMAVRSFGVVACGR